MHDNSTGTGRTPEVTQNGAAPCARGPNQSSYGCQRYCMISAAWLPLNPSASVWSYLIT